MKKLVLLLSALTVFASCQRKDYATFQKSNAPVYAQKHSSTPKEENSNVVSPQMTASSSELIDAKTFGNTQTELTVADNVSDVSLKKTESENVSAKASAIQKKSNKLKVTQTLLIKKLKKDFNKSSEKKTAVEGKVNTLSLLALIFGGAGLLLLGAGGFGLLLGIAGLVLGLIALKKKTPNKTMAILGVVFGGIAVLAALLVFTVLAAAFAI